MRATDLAEQTGHDVSTISRHLRSLEDDGLLARTPDPDDRRASLLEVTASGRDYLDRAVAVRTAMLADATGDWDPSDVATLARLLHRLATDLETT
jgi:DNA-binding MarR family transcriptional regulator